MAIRPLFILPDSVLRRVSAPVASVTPEIKKLVEDMFDTMYDAPGIGLAAIQIGVPSRVVTVDLAKPAAEGEAAVPKAPRCKSTTSSANDALP